MGQAHARDPLLPKCWPLYQCHCVCLRLSVSPAWISGRAHLWPSQPLSLKCKRVRFGTVVCRYPEVSLKGQTWALSPPAFSRSGRFYTFSIPPPLSSHSCIPSKPLPCCIPGLLWETVRAEDPEKLLVDEKLLHLWGHYSVILTYLDCKHQMWHCKTEKWYHTGWYFIGHGEIGANMRKKQSATWIPYVHCVYTVSLYSSEYPPLTPKINPTNSL